MKFMQGMCLCLAHLILSFSRDMEQTVDLLPSEENLVVLGLRGQITKKGRFSLPFSIFAINYKVLFMKQLLL